MATYPLTLLLGPDRADQFDGRTSPCVVALPILRVRATSRARWPAYGAPGHRANEVAIVSTCSFVTIRLRRGSRTRASTTLDPQSSPATVNAPLNPSVSATGSAAPPWSALATRVVETVERIASPSDPPTSWVELSRPEASPESSGATPLVAAIVAGTNDMPKPSPRMTMAGNT